MNLTNRPKGHRNGLCKFGHDTAVVGRDASGHCKSCEQERNNARLSSQMNAKRKSRYKLQKFLNSDMTPFTLASYDRLYQIQSGKCGICQKHQSELSRSLAVDHSHTTGIVRGLLCFDCNTSIGKLGDSVEKIERAIKYLRGTF